MSRRSDVSDAFSESHGAHPGMRLDKWLWAARFFKTRGLASEAVSGGKVHVNGARTKPAKPVHVGDALAIQRGPYTWTVVVRGLAELRGPARDAVLLYEETPESVRDRSHTADALRAEGPLTAGRPSKKDRRDLARLRRG